MCLYFCKYIELWGSLRLYGVDYKNMIMSTITSTINPHDYDYDYTKSVVEINYDCNHNQP